MNMRERVIKSLKFEDTDIVPYNIGFTIPAYEKLVEYYDDSDFISKIGNHFAVTTHMQLWEEVQEGMWKDESGAVWNRTVDKDIGTVEYYPLHHMTIEDYSMPEVRPEGKSRFSHYPAFVEGNSHLYRVSDFGFSLFERAWILYGMENLLADMVLAPTKVHELLDKILEYNLGIIGEALQYDIDAMMFGDDWGQQHGLIMGPRLWREFLKPRLARMYGMVRNAGKKVFIHSCGDVKEIFPDLIEIGVNVFNPFQPEVMDVVEMKCKYGKDLAFYGGLSTQKVLPYASPEEVKSEVKRLCREIGKGGGYILSPAHAIPKDVPVANMVAMIETLMQQ